MNRITDKYRKHLPEIARLYVAAGGNKAATERDVRASLGLKSFKADFLTRWLENAEFAAFVKEAEDGHANKMRLRPSVRGPERIAWLLSVEKALKERHDGKEAEGAKEADKDKILKALIAVGAEIRSEESHYENMLTRSARRDFARFLKNLIHYIKFHHRRKALVVIPVFEAALKHIDALMKGGKS